MPLAVLGLMVAVAIAAHLRQHEWMQEFIVRYPGTPATADGPESGVPAWLRWSHLFNLVFNGAVFYVPLFSTGQWGRIVPQSWDVIPNAASTMVQYLSLDFPVNNGFVAQLTAYFLTVFVFAPLAFITGLLQAPAIAARFGLGAVRPTGRSPVRSTSACCCGWCSSSPCIPSWSSPRDWSGI
ncbi:hypothetical protein [Mycolicibacter minnesotensis]